MTEQPVKKAAKKATKAPVKAVETEVVPSDKPTPKAAQKTSEAPVLRRAMEHGDKGDAIAWAQAKMASLGHEVGEIDGRFDTLLSKALRKVQQDHGMRVSGVLNPVTYEILKTL